AVVAGAGLDDDVVSNFGRASVLAHENVLARMSAPTGRQSPVGSGLWPTKTFNYHQYSMYLKGEGVQVIHQPAAHTDGDTIVFFRRGDVIATGDIVDTTRWPVIDTRRGGTVQGELDALNRLMDLTIFNLPLQWKADRTFLVPGHGHVYDKLDLLEYRDAVTIVRDRVQDPIDRTGYWVSIVTADWRWRMVTPAKGDYQGVQLNAEGRKVADTWDPAKDETAGEQCKSYGAPALMSVPGRLHITWQDDTTLKV